MFSASLRSVLARKELFWMAVVMLFGGVLVPETIRVGTTELGWLVSTLGSLIIGALLLGGIVLVLQTAYEGWRYGYAEAWRDGR